MIRNGVDRMFVMGRPFKPVLLWGVLTMTIVAQSNLRGADRGVEYPLSAVLGVMAVAAVVTISLSWLLSNQKLMEFGLLAIVAVYATRTAFVWINAPLDQAGWFGIAGILLAGGAYFVEVGDERAGVGSGRER